MRGRRVLINALSPTHGGGRSYIRNLLRELDRDPRGFAFSVLVASGQLAAEETGGLEVAAVRLPAGSGGAVLCRVLYEEAILPLRARRFDLVYCLADLAPVWAAAPTVVALRNLNIYDRRFYDNARLRTLERLVRLGLRRARRAVVPSRAAAELIAARLPVARERIAVIPHGIAPEAFAPAPAPAADRPPYLFLPASLERHKDIGCLIACLPHVADPRLEVWIAGASQTDPGYAAELREAARARGVAERVRFLGPVPYREILGHYRGALALAFPSRLESFGHPLLEAMLAGTPIVASDIPSSREVAGDVALYFPPGDALRLAAALDSLERDRGAAAARVERGRLRAAEFSWKRSADRLCAVFDEVLGS